MSRSSRKTKKSKKIKILLLLIIAILSTACCGGYLFYNYYMAQPVDIASNEEIILAIEKDETIRNIADMLKENGLIRETWAMKLRARNLNISYVNKAGNYGFKKSMTIDEMLEIINEGRTAYDYRMVIGDGTLISDLLLDFSETDTDEDLRRLANEINDIDYITQLRVQYPFLPAEILNDNLYYRLEGFLGNGIYYLKDEDSFRTFIEKALDQFQKDYEENNIASELEKIELSLFEVVTLASVVRGEVLSGDHINQRAVAGVFMNRLRDGWLLGSDVTTGYALGLNQANYTQDELDYDSPYNTRFNQGLPLGPISNPGMDVILNTINYDQTDKYYFLADICNDGHGEFGEVYYASGQEEFDVLRYEYLMCIYE